MIHVPGVYRWVCEAIVPFDKVKAIEVFKSLGMEDADAEALANPKQEVTVSEDGEDLILEFEIL